MALKVGTPVKQVVKPIEGVITQKLYDDKDDKFKFLVLSPDGSERWFEEADLAEQTPSA